MLGRIITNQSTLLRHNQEVPIRVNRGPPLHALISQIHVYGQSFAQGRVTRPGDGLEPGDEVDVAIGRDVEGQPSKLCG